MHTRKEVKQMETQQEKQAIKQYLLDNNSTQSKLARQIGISRQSLSVFLNSKIKRGLTAYKVLEWWKKEKEKAKVKE